MGLIGVVGIVIGIIIFVRGILFVRSNRRTVEAMFVWLVVGVCIVVFSADPNAVAPYIDIFGFQENSVLILIFGVLFLVLIVFFLYNMIYELREKVKILHDNLAILMSENKSRKSETDNAETSK